MPKIPENFIPLAEAAKLSGAKPNVLRKHNVNGWEEKGLAQKDGEGRCAKWFVDPAVIPTIKTRSHKHTEETLSKEKSEPLSTRVPFNSVAIEIQTLIQAAMEELMKLNPRDEVYSAIAKLSEAAKLAVEASAQ